MGNREALLEGAIRCLENRGYAQTTARDLVRESKTNLGAIGYHFGSKEALLYEALTVCFRRWLERLASEAISLAGTSPADLGTAILAKAYEAMRSDRSVVVAFFEALCQAERSEELRNQLAGFYRETARRHSRGHRHTRGSLSRRPSGRVVGLTRPCFD